MNVVSICQRVCSHHIYVNQVSDVLMRKQQMNIVDGDEPIEHIDLKSD